MAHFAELDQNKNVIQVIVVANDEILDNGIESEQKGIAFCKSLYGENTHWIQTSYNNNFRKNYAGIGFTYDEILDGFISPKPQDIEGVTWWLNPDTCRWEEV
jgi:hypothetical protein